MRPMTATTHLITALAVTAAAIATAFALPTTADAMTIVVGKGGPSVIGSGHMVDAARSVGAFSAIRIDGPVDVDAHPAAAPQVSVHADDNIEPLVETVVEDGTLVVRLRRDAHFVSHRALHVDVGFTTLDATRQHGSGDLRVTGVQGRRLESAIDGSGDLRIDDARLGRYDLRVAGSGDVTIAGHADEARFQVDGSGDVHAAGLAARRVEVRIAGSGDAQVDATESLDASVAGSGDVSYGGHPREVTRHVAGSGSVRER